LTIDSQSSWACWQRGIAAIAAATSPPAFCAAAPPPFCEATALPAAWPNC